MHFRGQTLVCAGQLRYLFRGMTSQPGMTMTRCKAGGLLVALLFAAGCSGSRADNEATALDFFKRGNAAYQKEDYRHAIRMYQQAATLDPRSPVIQYNLGLACYQAQTYPEAVQAYARALQLDPNMAEAHRNLALVQDRLYDLDSAQAHYNTYQAMVRAQQAKADAAPADGAADAAAKPANGAAGPDGVKKPARPAPKQSASAARDGAPQSVSELRRFGGDAKKNDSTAKSGDDAKWWTQDSTPRNR